MRTTATLLGLGIAYIAVDTMPSEVAGPIGLGLILGAVLGLIWAIASVGKRAR